VRPLRLRVQGFTSFRALQEVDFSELGLFVITGPTGAGKSSLLDAIALALYGEVPRTGKHGVAELISHGEAQARIELEFSADGADYRVARRLSRRAAQQVTLERRVDGGRWENVAEGGVKSVNHAIQGLLKLDFESFCKAVMLPQGEFARFLKGDPRERRTALEALLGLGVYARMRELAGQRARGLGERVEQMREILAGPEYSEASEEAVAAAEARAGEQERRARALSQALQQAAQQERRIGELTAKAQEARKRSAQLTELAGRLERLAQDCRTASEREREARRAHEQAEQEAARASEHRQQLAREMAELTERLGTVERVSRLLADAEKLPTHARALRESQARRDKVEQEQVACHAQLEALEQQSERAREALEAAVRQAEQAEERLRVAGERRERCERELDELREAEAKLQSTERQCDQQRRLVEQLEPAARRAEAELEAATQRVRELERADVVTTLTAGLAAGDPCPVCARPLEAEPRRHAHSKRKLEEAQAAVETAKQRHERASSELAQAQAVLVHLQHVHAEAQEQWRRALAGHGELAQVEALLVRARQEVEEAGQGKSAAKDALERAQAACAELRERLAAARATARGLEDRLNDARRTHENAHEQLEKAKASLSERFGSTIPDDAARRLEQDLTTLKEAQAALQRAYDAERDATERQRSAERELADVKGQLGKLEARLDSEGGAAQKALAELAALDPGLTLPAIPERGPDRAEHAASLAASGRMGSEGLAASAGRFDEQAADARTRIVQIARAQEVQVDGTADPLTALRSASEDAHTKLGALRKDAEALKERLGERRRLEQEIDQKRAQAAVFKRLADELRADNFIEFVIQETLSLLAERASEELRQISAGRYSLVSSSGEFSVVDHDNADEQRSVKTLSGGETFIAALAMALALSRHLSDFAAEGLGVRLETVFIDEGFGALDPESLEEVIDALERLRAQELLVGVISHVPEVAARIGDGLEVRREGNRSVVLPRAASPSAGDLRAAPAAVM